MYGTDVKSKQKKVVSTIFYDFMKCETKECSHLKQISCDDISLVLILHCAKRIFLKEPFQIHFCPYTGPYFVGKNTPLLLLT